MTNELRLVSPGKVNVTFDILGKRDDGYHEIDSIFLTITLSDELFLKKNTAGGVSLTIHGLPVPCEEKNNLILRACALFQQVAGIELSVDIELYKKIPLQSGMGGGSSNGATTLWGLNVLFKTGFTDAYLANLGAQLGSDLPFFFSSGCARCSGRGERVKPLTQNLKTGSFWVVVPKHISCATAQVYRAVDLNSINKSLEDGRNRVEAFLNNPTPWNELEDFVQYPAPWNALEAPALSVVPELAQIKEALLQEGFLSVTLTGSGSAFVCLPGKNGISFVSNDPRWDAWPVQQNCRKEAWYF